jgi:hypothetical protein
MRGDGKEGRRVATEVTERDERGWKRGKKIATEVTERDERGWKRGKKIL